MPKLTAPPSSQGGAGGGGQDHDDLVRTARDRWRDKVNASMAGADD